jgi:aryl-alcohol dehydrogenase-like predicted oxidoreductase
VKIQGVGRIGASVIRRRAAGYGEKPNPPYILPMMQKRRLGNSALEVSVVGLGGNNFGGRIDFDASQRVVHQAIELGVNLIDTADSNGSRGGSEESLGQILGGKRKRIVLATKFGLPMDVHGKLQGASRHYVMQAVEASLKRLRTDWIDLYQLHRPDPQTPIEETLRALDDLIREGKVRCIGCSNLSAKQITDAQATARRHGLTAFVCAQDEYSLLVRDIERELIAVARAHGMGVLPYFPLASGLLTGKYRRGAGIPCSSSHSAGSCANPLSRASSPEQRHRSRSSKTSAPRAGRSRPRTWRRSTGSRCNGRGGFETRPYILLRVCCRRAGSKPALHHTIVKPWCLSGNVR